mmetsp:Transcript_31525/g.100850  ORF Transcript_31525/g.100850 Transcript_31525/m.100850 type:complete len:364 (+) Transcript_31525:3-1094(+)
MSVNEDLAIFEAGSGVGNDLYILLLCAVMPENRQLLLRRRPSAALSQKDVEIVSNATPSLKDGQFLVKNLYASVDPTHRIWMSEDDQYLAPVDLDAPMRAMTYGVVEESKNPSFPVGAHVLGMGGIQHYYVGDPAADPGLTVAKEIEGLPNTAWLSVCSVIIGLTAWVGVNEICKPKQGETFVVSAGAGAVGSLAGQLAKLRGARVIGFVGSKEKADWIVNELGFDGAINYKTDDMLTRLKHLAPNGVDSYFDNTGGPSTEAVLRCFNNNARIALCGIISGYNTGDFALKNFQMLLHRRVNLQGFICLDHLDKYEQALAELIPLVKDKKIKYLEDIQTGIDNYPDVVNMLFEGSNKGKLMLKF